MSAKDPTIVGFLLYLAKILQPDIIILAEVALTKDIVRSSPRPF